MQDIITLRLHQHNMYTNMKKIIVLLFLTSICYNCNSQSLIDSYPESNASEIVWVYPGVSNRFSQSFVPAQNYKITSVKFYIYKSGSPTGNIYAYLYDDSVRGTGVHVPKYLPKATSDAFNIASLGTSAALKEFVFSGANQAVMTANTTYHVAIYSNVGSMFVSLRMYDDNTSPSHSGVYSTKTETGLWGSYSTKDLIFYVYGTVVVSTGNDFILNGSMF